MNYIHLRGKYLGFWASEKVNLPLSSFKLPIQLADQATFIHNMKSQQNPSTRPLIFSIRSITWKPFNYLERGEGESERGLTDDAAEAASLNSISISPLPKVIGRVRPSHQD